MKTKIKFQNNNSNLKNIKNKNFISCDESKEQCEQLSGSNGNPDKKTASLRCKACSGFEDKIHPAQIMDLPLGNSSLVESNLFSLSSILNENWNEIIESEKHEILVKISEMLDIGPKGLGLAEDIFKEIKYMITSHVIKFEFNKKQPLSTQLALWLDMKLKPKQREKMEKIIDKYFKNDIKNAGY